MSGPVSPHPCQTLMSLAFGVVPVFSFRYSDVCVLMSPCGVICMSLVGSDIEHLSQAYLPPVFTFWSSVYSCSLPIFFWIACFLTVEF